MSKKELTLVYYHVPEDNDDEETPNVFGVMTSKNNIRLQNIYDNFPLKGSYIFRFKVLYDNLVAWLDLAEIDTKLPTFKDKIVIKATRISWENNSNPYSHYRFIKNETSATSKESPVKPHTNFHSEPLKSKSEIKTTPTTYANLLDEKHEPVQNTKVSHDDFDLLGSTPSTSKIGGVDLGIGQTGNLI